MAEILLGKEYIFYIARLDPPLKGREFGEHPIKRITVAIKPPFQNPYFNIFGF